MKLIDEINSAWGWTGMDAREVINQNNFGNLIIRDGANRYWRLCPEDLNCEMVADDRIQLDILFREDEFLEDWNMSAMVEQAAEKFGPLADDRVYCLKMPGALGGEYGGDNLGTAPLIEVIGFSGQVAKQINDLPNGTQIKLVVTD